MTEPVTLLVPADDVYGVLAPEVAGKYLEIAGGSASDADGLTSSVAAALSKLTEGAPASDVTLALSVVGGAVEVHLRCGDRMSVVTQPIPARKS